MSKRKSKPPQQVPQWCMSSLTPEEQIEFVKFAVSVPEEHLETLLEYNRLLPPERIVSAQRGVDASRPRPSTRNAELQDWIDKSVAKSPELSAKERYNNAPVWVQRSVALGRFAKRVTEARKKLPAAR